MESNIEEALRAKATSEKHFMQKDLLGAKSYTLKAQMLCPELVGMSQMVAAFGVHLAAETKINGEPDFYSILGMDVTATKSKLKKQYKKLAMLLHPDKNKSVGADGAFRLVCEAWTLLSDSVNRRSHDQKRNSFAWNNSLLVLMTTAPSLQLPMADWIHFRLYVPPVMFSMSISGNM